MDDKRIGTSLPKNIFYLKSIEEDIDSKKMNDWALVLCIRMLELDKLKDIAEWVMRNFNFPYTVCRFYADDFPEYNFGSVMQKMLKIRYNTDPRDIAIFYNAGIKTWNTIEHYRKCLRITLHADDIKNIVILSFEPEPNKDKNEIEAIIRKIEED